MSALNYPTRTSRDFKPNQYINLNRAMFPQDKHRKTTYLSGLWGFFLGLGTGLISGLDSDVKTSHSISSELDLDLFVCGAWKNTKI